MARRKDHTPEQLKTMIHSAGEKLIYHKGLNGLTARALATAIGYTPGTIYNFYRDMDALVLDINYETLGRLHEFCWKRIAGLPPGFAKIRALTYAYVDFAQENRRAWETLFTSAHKNDKKVRLPKHYQEQLLELFTLIELTLQECLKLPAKSARSSARLLWACLHGITVLTLDGRLNLVDAPKPHTLIDDLLRKYLA